MEQTILSVAGKPGLYKLVSRGNMKLIVEALDGTKHRIPVFATDRITSLSDITMFTESEDLPLLTILGRLRDKEGGKECSINWRKASPKELQDYFASFVPDFDRDRVHNSDIKKLLQWYNILVKAGVTDFEDKEPENADNVEAEKAEPSAEEK